jgi:glutaminyl-tRNA synthetase
MKYIQKTASLWYRGIGHHHFILPISTEKTMEEAKGTRDSIQNNPESDTVTEGSLTKPTDFIRAIINEHNRTGRFESRVHTRFPPEPNGYLHIGHAKSVCLNFKIAADYLGLCNLRMDDTNPVKEEIEYIDSIITDVRWLGFDWDDRLFYASDYYGKLYEYAVELIKMGKAYVCDQSPEEMRQFRGTLTEPGRESPYRNRSIEENLALFERMKAGEFKEGEKTLRAKIDMTSPNLNMRDPVTYRILHATHHRTGDTWCIYPMYDFAHCFSDSIEGITHSICTLEFEDHRPLYDWYLDQLNTYHPQQIEFARLNLTYTVMSKRKLLQLVQQKYVDGWDDPRMPTISGMRRRGYTSEAIRNFCERIGVAKNDSIVDVELLEFCVREDLNLKAPRRMAVLNPLKIVIENYPEDKVEEFEIPNHPDDPGMGTRTVPFSKMIFIEQDDFMEEPPSKFFRLAPGREVRLRGAYFVTCTGVKKDGKTGGITELVCTYDPKTRGGDAPDGRKVKGTLHWVSAPHSIVGAVNLYERLFTVPNPEGGGEGVDFLSYLNPGSLEVLPSCRLEPSLADAQPGVTYQFERQGYFCTDPIKASSSLPAFNRTVTLKDTWAKIEKGKPAPDSSKAKDRPAAKKQQPSKTTAPKITIDEFGKVDLRVGLVREVSLVEGSDKLLKLMVDVGENKLRQIFAGIRQAYPDPDDLLGKKVAVVANLKEREMKFGISEGMILAGGEDDRMGIVTLNGDPKPGDKIS